MDNLQTALAGLAVLLAGVAAGSLIMARLQERKRNHALLDAAKRHADKEFENALNGSPRISDR